jgi:hypothetical protein
VIEPYAVVSEADRLAAQSLWPGFSPQTTPVAIYDGGRTLLFRHPAPPQEFHHMPGSEGVWAFTGRHPSVAGNSCAELGLVRTVTLLLPSTRAPLRTLAGLLIHEAFHIFQQERHPGWSANEAELFTYPVDDAHLLALRRLETEALRRALLSSTRDQAFGWARAALELRKERSGTLSQGLATYERQIELFEGLASYVEHRAKGEPDSAILPQEEFAPEAVRPRAYQTGLALARLLDRFSTTWQTDLEQNDSTPLDLLLDQALAARTYDAPTCVFTPEELARTHAEAATDIETLHKRRAEQRQLFLEQPGWRLVFLAPSAPLFPQGFDPLNVQIVAPNNILHRRFLRLGNQAGRIEVFGRAALTQATGEHPLFTGVSVLTITGLADQPVITWADNLITLKADGVTAEVRALAVETTWQTVTVRLESGP